MLTLPDLLAIAGRRSLPERQRPPYFTTKKVAIVGCTLSNRFAPWADPSWTILSHASARNYCQREPDWWFDLHPPACFKARKHWAKNYYAWLQHQTTPIFMQDAYPAIPGAVKYPKERILSEFRPYFTNHVAWMIALAMTEGVTHIGIYGCQYKAESEYGVQRESCVYWLGRFEGAGGTVLLPPVENNLLTTPKELYGYESHDAEGRLIASYNRLAILPKTQQAGSTADGTLRVLTPGEVPCHADLGVPVAWERSGFIKPEVHA